MVIILSLLTMDRIIITIVLFILLSIPFIVFQKQMSAWLSSVTEEADNKKEEKANSMSQNIFILLTILMSPILLMKVYSDSFLYLYVLLYGVISMGLLLVDPMGIITNNPLADLVFYATTFLSYAVLYTRPMPPIMIICIIVLCISMTNIARSYTDSQVTPKKKESFVNETFKPVSAFDMIGGGDDSEGFSIYPVENYTNQENKKNSKKKTEKKDSTGLIYFLVYTIPFCIAYIFAVRPSLLISLLNRPKSESSMSMDIQMNYTLLACVFFFVLIFYTTTTFKNYYGGEQWIRDPVSLLIPVEYKIVPSHDYMLSYWVYFEAVPPEYSSRASLFNNVATMGTIQTRYQPSTTTLRILIEDVDSPYDMPILTQTWNQVVLVGNQGQLDIFLNGNLKYTTHSITQPDESLLIGQENGIKGKICNVVYSPKTISHFMVQQMYIQLRLQNPPVI